MKVFWDYCKAICYTLWVELETLQKCDELMIKHFSLIRECYNNRISPAYCAYKVQQAEKQSELEGKEFVIWAHAPNVKVST